MMKKILFLLFIILSMTAPLMNAHPCYANAAEPPSLIIIVPNAPEDLEITIGPDNAKANRTDNAFQSYFKFSRYNLGASNYRLLVRTGDLQFEIALSGPLKTYNNVFTLDIEKQTLTPGKPIYFVIGLPALRVIITLAIESIVFFLFGYRTKRSWMVFLGINAVTLAFINIWLYGSFDPWQSYLLMSLIFGEFIVFIFEMAGFLSLIKEHRRLRTAAYVIIANLISLFVGGYLITVLSV